eukprot:18698-Heterococcus_DN1.PRE.2
MLVPRYSISQQQPWYSNIQHIDSTKSEATPVALGRDDTRHTHSTAQYIALQCVHSYTAVNATFTSAISASMCAYALDHCLAIA